MKWNLPPSSDCSAGRKRKCRAHGRLLFWWGGQKTFGIIVSSCLVLLLLFLCSSSQSNCSFSSIRLQPSPSSTQMTRPVWRSSWILGPPSPSCSPSCVSGFHRCSTRSTWSATRWETKRISMQTYLLLFYTEYIYQLLQPEDLQLFFIINPVFVSSLRASSTSNQINQTLFVLHRLETSCLVESIIYIHQYLPLLTSPHTTKRL